MEIRGSICALATPFSMNGDLDLDAFGRLLEYQLKGGTQAVVVAGSTGEAHMLGEHEFEQLLTFALRAVDGRVPVIAGTGEAGTAKTVALTRRAADLGADAALVVTPFYVRPTQPGLYRHFTEVAEQGGLPIILYNVPSRTGCDLLPETAALLRDHPRILGIKEARNDAQRIRDLAELARPDFVYLSGDDATAGQAMLAGAVGTISVVANLVPGAFRELCDAAASGRSDDTQRCMASLAPLVEALNGAPNPIAVKSGLPLLGLGTAMPRLPLVELDDDAVRQQIHRALARLVPLAVAA